MPQQPSNTSPFNIRGVGIDIIEISRVKEAIERKGQPFIDKLFTKEEQKYCFSFKESERHFAGRFAAKEAIAKAFGTGFDKETSWLSIEILNNSDGKPIATLHNSDAIIHLSISHCKEYATAYALVM